MFANIKRGDYSRICMPRNAQSGPQTHCSVCFQQQNPRLGANCRRIFEDGCDTRHIFAFSGALLHYYNRTAWHLLPSTCTNAPHEASVSDGHLGGLHETSRQASLICTRRLRELCAQVCHGIPTDFGCRPLAYRLSQSLSAPASCCGLAALK